MRPPPQPVEDYTDAFLTTLGALFFMMFWIIAAAAGWLWVAITATVIDRGIRLIPRLRG